MRQLACRTLFSFMNILALTGVEIAVLAVLCAVWLIFIALLTISLLICRAAFGSRCDKNPLLKYFSAEDFSLSAQTVELLSSKDEALRAVIYKKAGVPPKKELLIFCHGMGPGHVAYTTEIAYFCNLGYTVLAPDYYGCNLSDGKNISEFASGRLSVECAVDYARRNMAGYDGIYLVGHSWGGWSAICAGYEKRVDKIVAISAPDRGDRAICDAASSRLPKFFTFILRPFIKFICGDKSAAKLAQNCTCPVLLVHGDGDKTVPCGNSVYHLAEGGHITKYLVEGRGHNPYNTPAAEQKLFELSAALKRGEGEEFFKNFDFSAATEEDKEVMGEIARFLADNSVKKH